MASVPMKPVSMAAYSGPSGTALRASTMSSVVSTLVVLDLDQPDDVGVDRREGGDDLGPLAHQLLRASRRRGSRRGPRGRTCRRRWSVVSMVLNELSTLKLATRRSPPTGSGSAVASLTDSNE